MSNDNEIIRARVSAYYQGYREAARACAIDFGHGPVCGNDWTPFEEILEGARKAEVTALQSISEGRADSGLSMHDFVSLDNLREAQP